MLPRTLILLLLCVSRAAAHDTWVETNTNLIRTGDAVYVDLKLGNHGNDHRDFKLASKVDLEPSTLVVVGPDGKTFDLKHELVDVGYSPKEGYWTSKFAAAAPGLYMVAHTMDKVVNHGHPVRSIKSGKTFFVVSPTLDRVTADNPGYDHAMGHALELVPWVNPVTPMGPGKPITVQVLFRGQPLADARVAFVPNGGTLKDGFDEQYERQTDADGRATFVPKTGNRYLVVVHKQADTESGKDYDSTLYSATLTVLVPEVCPCCGD
jgi:uncharacterized GH25 family protein